MQKKIDEGFALIAQTEHEILETKVGIILHDVPDDRFAADRNHRFGEGFVVIANPGPHAAAENNDFHVLPSLTKPIHSIVDLSALRTVTFSERETMNQNGRRARNENARNVNV
jgi:hypothetical protein